MGTTRAIAGLLLILAACGDDDTERANETDDTNESAASTVGTATDPTAKQSAPAAECESGEADPSRTITISIDDEVGGFGSIGSQAPSGLTPGTVRVVVEADSENADPVTVTLRTGDVAYEIAEVAPGTECGADLDLGPGEYVVTSDVNGGDSTFTVT